MSSGEFGPGVVGAVDRVAIDVGDVGGLGFVEVGLFAQAGEVVGAVEGGLHPAEAGVAGGGNLFFFEGDGVEREVAVAAFVQQEGAVVETRADDFGLVRGVDEEAFVGVLAGEFAGGGTEVRIGGAVDFDVSQESEFTHDVEAEVGDVGRGGVTEDVDEGLVEVVGKGVAGVGVPLWGDALEIERGELALELVFKFEVEGVGLVGVAVVEGGAGFAGVMVGIVIEEVQGAADLLLQLAGGEDFGDEEALREEAGGLLAEGDSRGHGST